MGNGSRKEELKCRWRMELVVYREEKVVRGWIVDCQ